MKISGARIILRDERRESDDEDLFRWLNLKEWSYYDEPDKPFAGITRPAFEKLRAERQPRPETPVPHAASRRVFCAR